MPRDQDLPGELRGQGRGARARAAQPKTSASRWRCRSGRRHDPQRHARRGGEPGGPAGRGRERTLTGEVPAATAMLPAAALGDRSGGPVVTDPADTEGMRTLEPVFLFDVRLPASRVQRVGGARVGALRPRRESARYAVAAPPACSSSSNSSIRRPRWTAGRPRIACEQPPCPDRACARAPIRSAIRRRATRARRATPAGCPARRGGAGKALPRDR